MKKIIEQYVSLWNVNDPSSLDKVFTNHSKYWDSNQAGNAIDLLTYSIPATHQAFANAQFKAIAIHACKDHQVFLEWHMIGHPKSTPRSESSITIAGMDLITLEGDRISEIKSFYDSSFFVQKQTHEDSSHP